MLEHWERATQRDAATAQTTTAIASVLSAGLIAVAVVFLVNYNVVDRQQRAQWWRLAPAAWLAVPYLVITWQAVSAATYTAAFFAFVQGVLGLVFGIPALLIAILGAGLSSGNADAVRAMYAIAAFTVAQAVLAAAARRTERALAASRAPGEDHNIVIVASVGWMLVALLLISAATDSNVRTGQTGPSGVSISNS